MPVNIKPIIDLQTLEHRAEALFMTTLTIIVCKSQAIQPSPFAGMLTRWHGQGDDSGPMPSAATGDIAINVTRSQSSDGKSAT